MNEILRIIHTITGKSEWRKLNSDELFFELGNFHIKISLVHEEEEDDFEDHFKLIDDINEIIDNINYEGVKSISVEFIEETELRIYSENINDNNQCISVARTTFNLIQSLNKIIPNLIHNYDFKLDYGDSMCQGEPNYVGRFSLNLDYISSTNVSQIIKTIENAMTIEHSEIYHSPKKENGFIDINYRTRILNTNTKVRRLGYLKIFFEFLAQKQKLPETFANKKFESYAIGFNTYLDDIENSKGLIQDLKGKSAHPYFELIKELSLVASVNRLIVPSKSLRVYIELRKDFPAKNVNPFILDELDKLFFLEIILKEDYLYFSLILESIFIKRFNDTKSLIKNFQSLLLERLSAQLVFEEIIKENKGLAEIKTIKKRVEAWKAPKVYLEHVIMPRLNWMADLGLITLSENNTLSITSFGESFFNEMVSWIDVNCERVENSELFLKKYFPHTLSYASYNFYWKELMPLSDVVSLVDLYIDKSFECFKTLAPNRVTSSQAILYAKYCIYLNHKFSVSNNLILTILENNLKDKYIYKFQPQYEDGYIQKS